MAKLKQRATYDDLLKLPEHLIGEIVEGELIVSPRPRPSHAQASSMLAADLVGPFNRALGGHGAPGGWWVLFEPELHLHGDVLVPDLAGWRRARMPQLPQTAAFELPPDWVCEVLSPSTARFDRAKKMRVYEREQVPHVWLVDPLNRTLEAFVLDGARLNLAAVHGEGDKVNIAPFEAVELDLSRFWVDTDAGSPPPAP